MQGAREQERQKRYLERGKHGEVDLVLNVGYARLVEENHAGARPGHGLVSGGGDEIGVLERAVCYLLELDFLVRLDEVMLLSHKGFVSNGGDEIGVLKRGCRPPKCSDW
jgi:hypothetical protein